MKKNHRQLNKKNIVVWRFVDGKPGHEKQTQGLVLALSRLFTVDCVNINCDTSTLKNISNWFFSLFPEGKYHPSPDLIIGAGSKTHLSMLVAKRAYGGKTIVLMKPSLPYLLFDLCAVPKHDNPPSKINVINTEGVLNAVIKESKKINPQRINTGCFMIGGTSRHYKWSSVKIARQIKDICINNKKTTWVLTTSRRTPKNFINSLELDKLTKLKVHKDSNQRIEDVLLSSSIAVVTPDSVSMIYEALTAGCKVMILNLIPINRNSKLHKNLDELRSKNYLLDQVSISNPRYSKPFPNQADLVAKKTADLLHQSLKSDI